MPVLRNRLTILHVAYDFSKCLLLLPRAEGWWIMGAYRIVTVIVVCGQEQSKAVASTITLVLEVGQEWAATKFFLFFDSLELLRLEGISELVFRQATELCVQFCNDGPELIVVLKAQSTADATAAIIILQELILPSPCQCPEKSPATWNQTLLPHLFYQPQPELPAPCRKRILHALGSFCEACFHHLIGRQS